MYPKNSFADSQNLNEKNYLINTINEWWIKEKFNLGIEKCLNKVNNYLFLSLDCTFLKLLFSVLVHTVIPPCKNSECKKNVLGNFASVKMHKTKGQK